MADRKCNQEKCDREANTRVFWPGRPPMETCIVCAAKAQRIGDAMGCYIGIEELVPDGPDPRCNCLMDTNHDCPVHSFGAKP